MSYSLSYMENREKLLSTLLLKNSIKRRLFKILCIVLSALYFCGCVNVSSRTLETKASEGTEEEIVEVYDSYTFSKDDESFISSCVFVGNAVCGGLSYYGLVSQQNVLFSVDRNSENLLELPFSLDGDSIEPLAAIVNANKANIVLWLSAKKKDVFSDEVENALGRISAVCPYAELYVISAPPPCSENAFVFEYNRSVSQMLLDGGRENLHFVSTDSVLSSSAGLLKSNYNSGGEYMSRTAYYAVLWQLCAERQK